jgi:FkbM family methyltransferase
MAQGRNLHLLFDVGANNGLTTRVFVENFPGARVRAFEPIPEVAGAARKRHEGNPHVTVECLALDECSGKRVFRVNSFSETSSFLDSNRLLQSNGLWLNDALFPHAGRPLDGWENQLNSRVSGVNPTAR